MSKEKVVYLCERHPVLQLTVKPATSEAIGKSGRVKPVAGVYINFVAGVYETSNEDEIAFLDDHAYTKQGKIVRGVKDKAKKVASQPVRQGPAGVDPSEDDGEELEPLPPAPKDTAPKGRAAKTPKRTRGAAAA